MISKDCLQLRAQLRLLRCVLCGLAEGSLDDEGEARPPPRRRGGRRVPRGVGEARRQVDAQA